MNIFFLLSSFLLIIISLSIHEFAHAWAANKFGDDTAARMGRKTINPLVHIDVFGTIFVPIVLSYLGLPLFGWAKPVPVNVSRVENPSVGLPLISAAGPLSNMFQMALGCLLWFICNQIIKIPEYGIGYYLYPLLGQYITINFTLAFFNLIPIPPLDGASVITLLMPDEMAARYENTMARMGSFPLVILLFLNFSGFGVFRFWFGLWAPLGNLMLHAFSIPIDLRNLFY
ncbi:MAG: site-2 protease family protein [Fibrobacteria bacterium]|nr:site-2 protease family protein [Fibrobacteria bacterium]